MNSNVGPFLTHVNFIIGLSNSTGTSVGNFIGIRLNLYINLNRIDFFKHSTHELKTLRHSIHEHGICLFII